MMRADGDARMRTSLVVVSASLTLAIVLLAGFLIATQARGAEAADGQHPRCVATKLTTICGK